MKAFDIVPNQRLLRVLRFYNTPENLVKWIEDFLSERKQRVTINGVFSKWHDVIIGEHYGSLALVHKHQTKLKVPTCSFLLMTIICLEIFTVIAMLCY